MIYVVMHYNYNHTDIILATLDIKEAIKELNEYEGYSLQVWDKEDYIEVYYSQKDNKWHSSPDERALNDTYREMYDKFLDELKNNQI